MNFKPNEFKGVVGKQSPHRVYDATYNIGQQLSSSDDSCDSFKDNLIIAEETAKNDLAKLFEEENFKGKLLVSSEVPILEKSTNAGKSLKETKLKSTRNKNILKPKKEKSQKNVRFDDEVITIGRCTRSRSMLRCNETESIIDHKKDKNVDISKNKNASNETITNALRSKSRNVKTKSKLENADTTEYKAKSKASRTKCNKNVTSTVGNKATTNYSIENILNIPYNLRNGLTIERVDHPIPVVQNDIPLNLSKKAMLNPEVSIEIINEKQKTVDLKPLEDIALIKQRRSSSSKRKHKQINPESEGDKLNLKRELENTPGDFCGQLTSSKSRIVGKAEPRMNTIEIPNQEKTKIWQPFEDTKEDICEVRSNSNEVMSNVIPPNIQDNIVDTDNKSETIDSVGRRSAKGKEKRIVKNRKQKKNNSFSDNMKENLNGSIEETLLESYLMQKEMVLKHSQKIEDNKIACVKVTDVEHIDVEAEEDMLEFNIGKRRKGTNNRKKNKNTSQGKINAKSKAIVAEVCKISEVIRLNIVKDVDIKDKTLRKSNRKDSSSDKVIENNRQEKEMFLKNYELVGKASIKTKMEGRKTRKNSITTIVAEHVDTGATSVNTTKSLLIYEKENPKRHKAQKNKVNKINTRETSKRSSKAATKERVTKNKGVQKVHNRKISKRGNRKQNKNYKRNKNVNVRTNVLKRYDTNENIKQDDGLENEAETLKTASKCTQITINELCDVENCCDTLQVPTNLEVQNISKEQYYKLETQNNESCHIANIDNNKIEPKDLINASEIPNVEPNTADAKEPEDCYEENKAVFELKSDVPSDIQIVEKHPEPTQLSTVNLGEDVPSEIQIVEEHPEPIQLDTVNRGEDEVRNHNEHSKEHMIIFNDKIEQSQITVGPELHVGDESSMEEKSSEDQTQQILPICEDTILNIKDTDKTDNENVIPNVESITIDKENKFDDSVDFREALLCDIVGDNVTQKENEFGVAMSVMENHTLFHNNEGNLSEIQAKSEPVIIDDFSISEKTNCVNVQEIDSSKLITTKPQKQVKAVDNQTYIPDVEPYQEIEKPMENSTVVDHVEESTEYTGLTLSNDEINKSTGIDCPSVPIESKVEQKKLSELLEENKEPDVESYQEIEKPMENATVVNHVEVSTEYTGITFSDDEINKSSGINCPSVPIDSKVEQQNLPELLEENKDPDVESYQEIVKPMENSTVVNHVEESTEYTGITFSDDEINKSTGINCPSVPIESKVEQQNLSELLEENKDPDVESYQEIVKPMENSTVTGLTLINDEINKSTGINCPSVPIESKVEQKKLSELLEENKDLPEDDRIFETLDDEICQQNSKNQRIDDIAVNNAVSSNITEENIAITMISNEGGQLIENSNSFMHGNTEIIENGNLEINLECQHAEFSSVPQLHETVLSSSQVKDTADLAVNVNVTSIEKPLETSYNRIRKRKRSKSPSIAIKGENCKKSNGVSVERILENLPESISCMFKYKPVVKLRKICNLEAYRDEYIFLLKNRVEEKNKDKLKTCKSKGKNLDAIVNKLVTSLKKRNEMWKKTRTRQNSINNILDNSTDKLEQQVSEHSLKNIPVEADIKNKQCTDQQNALQDQLKDGVEKKLAEENVDTGKRKVSFSAESDLQESKIFDLPIEEEKVVEVQSDKNEGKYVVVKSVDDIGMHSAQNVDRHVAIEIAESAKALPDVNIKDHVRVEKVNENTIKSVENMEEVIVENHSAIEGEENIEMPLNEIISKDDSTKDEERLRTDNKQVLLEPCQINKAEENIKVATDERAEEMEVQVQENMEEQKNTTVHRRKDMEVSNDIMNENEAAKEEVRLKIDNEKKLLETHDSPLDKVEEQVSEHSLNNIPLEGDIENKQCIEQQDVLHAKLKDGVEQKITEGNIDTGKRKIALPTESGLQESKIFDLPIEEEQIIEVQSDKNESKYVVVERVDDIRMHSDQYVDKCVGIKIVESVKSQPDTKVKEHVRVENVDENTTKSVENMEEYLEVNVENYSRMERVEDIEMPLNETISKDDSTKDEEILRTDNEKMLELCKINKAEANMKVATDERDEEMEVQVQENVDEQKNTTTHKREDVEELSNEIMIENAATKKEDWLKIENETKMLKTYDSPLEEHKTIDVSDNASIEVAIDEDIVLPSSEEHKHLEPEEHQQEHAVGITILQTKTVGYVQPDQSKHNSEEAEDMAECHQTPQNEFSPVTSLSQENKHSVISDKELSRENKEHLFKGSPTEVVFGVTTENRLLKQLEEQKLTKQLQNNEFCSSTLKETLVLTQPVLDTKTTSEVQPPIDDAACTADQQSVEEASIDNSPLQPIDNHSQEERINTPLQSSSKINNVQQLTQDITDISSKNASDSDDYAKQLQHEQPPAVDERFTISNNGLLNECTLKVRPAKELLEKYKFMQEETYETSSSDSELVVSPVPQVAIETNVEPPEDQADLTSYSVPNCDSFETSVSIEITETVIDDSYVEHETQIDNTAQKEYPIVEQISNENSNKSQDVTEQPVADVYDNSHMLSVSLPSFNTQYPEKYQQNKILSYHNQPISQSVLSVSFDADQFLSDVMLDKRLPYLESCSEILGNVHTPSIHVRSPHTKIVTTLGEEPIIGTDNIIPGNMEKIADLEVEETNSDVNIMNTSDGFSGTLSCNGTIDVDDPQLAEKVKSMGFAKIGSESSDHDYITFGGPLLVGKYEQPHSNESPEMSPSRQVSIGAHTENAMASVSNHDSLVNNVTEQYNPLSYNFIDTQDYNFINKVMGNVMHHQTSISDTSSQYENTLSFSNDNLLSSTRIDDTSGPDFTINSFPLSDLALCDIEDFYTSETISPDKIIVNPLKTLNTIPNNVIDVPQNVTVKVNEYEFASTDNMFKNDTFTCPNTPKLNTSDSLIECVKKMKEKDVKKDKVKTKAEKKVIDFEPDEFPFKRNKRTRVTAPELPKKKNDKSETNDDSNKINSNGQQSNSKYQSDMQKWKLDSSSSNVIPTSGEPSKTSKLKTLEPMFKQSSMEKILPANFAGSASEEELQMKPDKLEKLIFAIFDDTDTDLLNVDSPNILESPTRVTVKINEYEFASTDNLYNASYMRAKKEGTLELKSGKNENQKPKFAKKLDFSAQNKNESSIPILNTSEVTSETKSENSTKLEQKQNSTEKENSKQKVSDDKAVQHKKVESNVQLPDSNNQDTEIDCGNKHSKKKQTILETNVTEKIVLEEKKVKDDSKLQNMEEKVIQNPPKEKDFPPIDIKVPKQPEQNSLKEKNEIQKILETPKEVRVSEPSREKTSLLSTTIPSQKYQSEVQRWRPDATSQYHQKMKSTASNGLQYPRLPYSISQRSESRSGMRSSTYVRKEEFSKSTDKSGHTSGTSRNYYQPSSNNYQPQAYYPRQDSRNHRPPSRAEQRKPSYGRPERSSAQGPLKSSSRNVPANDKSYWDHKNTSRLHQCRSERITGSDYQKQSDQRGSANYNRVPQSRSERNIEAQYPSLDNSTFSRNKYDEIKRRSHEKSLRNQVNNSHEGYYQLLTTTKAPERQKRKSSPMGHTAKVRKFEEERKDGQLRKRGNTPGDETARKPEKDRNEIFTTLVKEGNINKNCKVKLPLQSSSSNCYRPSSSQTSSNDNWLEKFSEKYSLNFPRNISFGD